MLVTTAEKVWSCFANAQNARGTQDEYGGFYFSWEGRVGSSVGVRASTQT